MAVSAELPLEFPDGTTPVTCRVSVYDSSSDSKVGVGSLMDKASIPSLPSGSLYMEEVHAKVEIFPSSFPCFCIMFWLLHSFKRISSTIVMIWYQSLLSFSPVRWIQCMSPILSLGFCVAYLSQRNFISTLFCEAPFLLYLKFILRFFNSITL